MTSAEERALIRRIVAGDRAAAEALIRAQQPALYAFTLRLSGRPEVAEDVVQEAFVRALSNIERFDPRFRFSTWLFTIAKRVYVNARARLGPVYDTDTVGGVAGVRDAQAGIGNRDAGVPAERLDARVASGRVLEEAMGTLSDEQREVLILYYQISWGVEQIGEYLGLPAGTVKSHLFRARRRIREYLCAHGAQVPAAMEQSA